MQTEPLPRPSTAQPGRIATSHKTPQAAETRRSGSGLNQAKAGQSSRVGADDGQAQAPLLFGSIITIIIIIVSLPTYT